MVKTTGIFMIDKLNVKTGKNGSFLFRGEDVIFIRFYNESTYYQINIYDNNRGNFIIRKCDDTYSLLEPLYGQVFDSYQEAFDIVENYINKLHKLQVFL